MQKVSITGDDVPTLTENFRYYRAVHMFPDGSVAFAGVTTRGANLLRNIPRGIYYAAVPGALTTVAEMDDTQAWKSIGVPYHLLDSNSAKTFSYDSLDPLPSSLQEVVYKRDFGLPIQPLTPTDDSNTTIGVYEGRFESDLGGLVLNEAGQTLFVTSFFFSSAPNDPVQGIFQHDDSTGLRNVVFAGDDVPGITGATFSSFHSINQAEDGSVLFSALMAGTGAPSGTNDALWIEKDGAFTLVLREGSPAPGFADRNINLSGGLNLLYLDVQGERTIVFAGTAPLGGALIRTYWIGTPFAATLTPFLQVDNIPNLSDPDIFTATDQGDIAFTTVDNNSIQLDIVGEVYFTGGGKFANDTSIAGIWKRSIIDGNISLLVPWDFASGLTNFELLDVSNDGDVLFLAEDTAGVKGLWVRDAAGTLENVVNVGDMLEGREILNFADLSTVSGLFSQSTKTLGDHRFHDLFSSSGNFVFVALFADDNGDGKLDEGVFTAQALPDPTTQFIWSGEAGDDDWHKPLNWDDEATGLDATHAPGGTGGTETVKILDADVTISSAAVHIDSITAGGSLTVNQPFTIEDASTIEDLTLNADLTIADDLRLLGMPQLQDGRISGTGSIIVEELATATLVPSGDGGSDMKEINLNVQVPGTVDHGDGVTVEIKKDAMVTIPAGGSYRAKSGKLAYTALQEALPRIEVAGSFEVAGANGGSPFTVEAPFQLTGGEIDVQSGELIFNTDARHEGGDYAVAAGARLVFGPSIIEDLYSLGTDVTETVTGAGDGTIEFRNSSYFISTDKTASFNMSLATGGVEINEGSVIWGQGTLHNAGRMVFNKGRVTSAFVNDGTLVIDGGAFDRREISDTQLINNSTLLQQQAFLVDVKSDSDPRQGIVNKGTYEIGGDVLLLGLNGTQANPAVFENATEGTLRKSGSGDALFDQVILENKGRVIITEGTLYLKNSIWRDNPGIGGNTDIEIAAGAGLNLAYSPDLFDLLSVKSGHEITNSTKIQGGGTLTIDGSLFFFSPPFSTDLKLVNDASQLDLRPHRIHARADTLSTIENLGGTIHIHNPDGLESDLVVNRVDLVNRAGSTVTHDDGVKLVLEDAAQLINEGEYRFKTGSSDIGAGLLASARKLIRNTGTMIFETGESHTISPKLELVEGDKRGRVEAINGTSVVFESAAKSVQLSGVLTGGNWLVGPGSKIEIQPDISLHLGEIGGMARVRLEGSSDAFVPDGKLNDLPNVTGDFNNYGELILAGSTFKTTGDFNNYGNLFLNPGVLIAEGANGFFNPGDLGGTGVINGRVVNGGEFVPGFSPGSITVNGDYTQNATGTLRIELGGLESAHDFDEFIVNGNVVLEAGARIIITLIDPNPDDDIDEIFIPRTGDSFAFLQANNVEVPMGMSLSDFIEFTNLPAGVDLVPQLAVVNGKTQIMLETDSTLTPPPGPRITSHPKATTTTAGSPTTLSVSVDGATDYTYQWQRNGVDIPGATDATFTLPSTQFLHAGDYTVVVTADGVSTTSKIASLVVDEPPPSTSRLVNISTRAIAGSGESTLILGFYIAGTGSKTLMIRGVGPELALAPFNLPNVVSDPSIVVYSGQTAIDSNDNWDPSLEADFTTVGAFPLTTGSKDAALKVTLPPGGYTVHLVNTGQLAEGLVEIYDYSKDPGTRLANLSTRLLLGEGETIIVGTYVENDPVPLPLVIRNVGPGLGTLGLVGYHPDPRLRIYSGQTDIGFNDDWDPTLATRFSEVGAFPLDADSKDAAARVALKTGGYTVHATGIGEGVVIVELYENRQ